jgi:hypothetical protein
MRALLKETKEIRVESEASAMELIEEERENPKGIVEFKTAHKTKKSKGEIVEEWYIVTVTRKYTI